jgi:uncharacterized membrane protein
MKLLNIKTKNAVTLSGGTFLMLIVTIKPVMQSVVVLKVVARPFEDMLWSPKQFKIGLESGWIFAKFLMIILLTFFDMSPRVVRAF